NAFTLNFIDAFELNPYALIPDRMHWRHLPRCARTLSHRSTLEIVSAMNIQDPALRASSATEPGERLFLDGNGAFAQRTAAVAAVAAAEADDVDRNARFPKAAIDAARQQKLLGAQIPVQFGGHGASIAELTDMCYALGRACSSTAMIFAMHQTKVACLVRHGAGSPWHEKL